MRVSFRARGVWENDAAHLPAALLPSTGSGIFSKARSVDTLSVDHCFAGWAHEARLSCPDAGL